ncbi:MAG: F-box protein [Alphaproteobacteria bacterium]|nr:F-box protein [Alphaproteobacteria bacterium]
MNYSFLNVFFLSFFTLSISFSSLLIATPPFIPSESESDSLRVSTHIINNNIKTEKEEDDVSDESQNRPGQITLNPFISHGKWPSELLLKIFSFLNQRDIPSVARTCKKWNSSINDKVLWKEYVKRAFRVMDHETLPLLPQNTSYKAFLENYCSLPLFTDLGGAYCNEVIAVSYDGSVIIVNTLDDRRQELAYRWTSEGMKPMTSSNGHQMSKAKNASFNGSVIIGTVKIGGKEIASRWTNDIGIEFLGPRDKRY